MKYCKKCNVKIRGTAGICPLCQAQVQGEDERVYPVLDSDRKKRFHRLKKTVWFLLIVGCVVSVAINLMVPQSGVWAQYVILGAATGCALLFVWFRRYANIVKRLLYVMLSAAVLCLFWDIGTGWRSWSIDFALPIICASALLLMSFLRLVLRLSPPEYVDYMFSDILFGIGLFVVYLTGANRVVIPTLICFAVCMIWLTKLILFEGRSFYAELKKKSHL